MAHPAKEHARCVKLATGRSDRPLAGFGYYGIPAAVVALKMGKPPNLTCM